MELVLGRKKKVSSIITALSLLILSGILSLGFNATPLLATAEYSKFSTRGSSELKLQPNGTPKEQSSGLEYDYITEYSYGIFESLNLFVPRIQGGGSSENLGKEHGVYDFLKARGVGQDQAIQFSKKRTNLLGFSTNFRSTSLCWNNCFVFLPYLPYFL